MQKEYDAPTVNQGLPERLSMLPRLYSREQDFIPPIRIKNDIQNY
jgi:hypothetical protein